MNTQTFLITGGTGFIGKALCQRLQKDGHRVYVLTRQNRLPNENSLFYVNSLASLAHIPIDTVINLTGEPIAQRWTNTSRTKITESRWMTTRSLVDHMNTMAEKPKLFITASAVGYYGTDSDRVFDETTPITPVPEAFGQHVCHQWEAEAQKAESLGIRVVYLRIGPVLEKDGGMLSKLLPSFYWGLGSILGNGKQWISWIDREDLLNLIEFIRLHSDIQGPVNATSPQPVTQADFSYTLAQVLRRPCVIKTPACVLKMMFGAMTEEILLKGQKVLPQKALSHGFVFQYPELKSSLKKILDASEP